MEIQLTRVYGRPHNYLGDMVCEPVGHVWGFAELLDRTLHRDNGVPSVEVRCTSCAKVSVQAYLPLRTGKSKGCGSCSKSCGAPKWLIAKMQNAYQRCNNKNNPQYHRYGGRGIKFLWPSVAEAAVWALSNLAVSKDLELDRTDNDGNYEPGNVRFVPRVVNANNIRKSKLLRLTAFRNTYPSVTYSERYLKETLFNSGLTDEQIAEKWGAQWKK